MPRQPAQRKVGRGRSIAIEGYSVPSGEGPGIVAGSDPARPDDTDRMALAGYARAMDLVGTMAIDPHVRIVQ